MRKKNLIMGILKNGNTRKNKFAWLSFFLCFCKHIYKYTLKNEHGFYGVIIPVVTSFDYTHSNILDYTRSNMLLCESSYNETATV
jgi:hypothetical protein